ncbi:MAG: ABC transporter ATP-binding protein [Deltaproteobacteria bacterium]|nr:MAG: ABC transporter ATP-binding protein [Deltaproteobacteria bacterium]
MDTVLKFAEVWLGYNDEAVLRDINLEINAGQVTVIAGASGCGKSTLLRGAIGLLSPRRGRISLLGQDLARLDENRLAALRQQTGLLFQGGALINSLTVAENVALPIRQFSRLSDGAVQQLVRMKLAQVGLEAHWNKTPPELSGGMRKRAALARALAMDPQLLLCDEPTAGLDPVTAAGMDRLLLSLREALGMTLVVVTHEVGSIETIADRVVLLADGRLAFDGSLQQAHASSLAVVRDFFSRRARPAAGQGKTLLERFGSGETTGREERR